MTARAGVLAMSIVACTHPRPPVNGAALANVQRWWIVIGHSPVLESLDWRHYARDAQMVVVSGDPRIPIGDFPSATIRLAYVSVGEADARRPYWPAVRGQPFLVEPNPDWPDNNIRVDVRDPRWQDILLREEVPRLMKLGFDGLMLDTIDTAPYLENKDPARFAGSRQALRDWLRRAAREFPRAVVIANGGAALVDAAPVRRRLRRRGGVLDLRPRPARSTGPRPTPNGPGSWARSRARATIARKPVFSIEYADVGDVALSRWAFQESVRHGFRPYVGVRDLNTAP